MVKTVHLNDNWKYIPDYKEKYIEDFPTCQIVDIPHANIETPYNNFNEEMYQFVSTYLKTFTVSKSDEKRYFIHFDGVMAKAKVYLNKHYLGEHLGGYTPFKFEVTEYLEDENELIVVVDSREIKEIPPFGYVVDYLTYGGIYREVYLTETRNNFIENVYVDTSLNKVNIKMENNILDKEKVNLEFKIKDLNDETVLSESKSLELLSEITFSFTHNLEKWDLEHPVLYMLEIYINNELAKEIEFGYRKVEFRNDGFYLNESKIKLMGLNRHQSYPYVGYAMPKNAQVKDADILKYELGCNIVRSSHYPPSKHFLKRCDEIGLLVFEEIPGWQHIGDLNWQEIANTNVREMIERDYNHPSVIIWGVRINESPDSHEFYMSNNRLAKSLDKSRPTGGVRNFAGSDFLEDVYTYNDFIHRGDNVGLNKRKKITKKKVPYLITEYNGHMYPTKKFDDEPHRINHAKRHLAVQNASFKDSDISGAIGWAMFDYNTHKDFGSGDRICYHGVLDMFRIPKFAASVYSANGLKQPVMEVLSNFNIGEYPASEIKEVMVNTNVDYIKFYINDDYIDTFYRDNTLYKYLPHPPIIVDDFIGDLIKKNESYSEKDAALVKQILRSIIKNGLKFSLRDKLKLIYFMKKHKMSKDKFAKFYDKYIGRWGQESMQYRIDGYLDDTLVITKYKGTFNENFLNIYADDLSLTEESTYEVTRVVVKHQDKYQNDLIYSNEPIRVRVTGALKLIGPDNLSLIGGSIGFYVRTIHKKGIGKIEVNSDRFDKLTLEIKVV